MDERQIENYFLGLLGLYTLLGFYGTLWISDEFDQERGWFYAFFAIPWAFYFFIRFVAQRNWRRQAPTSFILALVLLIGAFAWGNFLALNAISGSQRNLVNVTLGQGVLASNNRRGGFDWLYKTRW